MGMVVGMKARERNEWTSAVGRQIKAERVAAGLTQEAVYTAADVSPAQYKRIEAGSRVVATDQLLAILGVLGLPGSRFFERVEQRIVHEMNLTPEESADIWAAIQRRNPPAPPAIEDANHNNGQANG